MLVTLLYRCEQEQRKGYRLCRFLHSPTNYEMTVTNESSFILRFLGNNTRKLSSKCDQFLTFLVCFLLFRSCEPPNVTDPASGFQLTICQDKCAGVDKLYQECTIRENVQIAVGNSTNEILRTLVSFSGNFTCSNPGTYIVREVPISGLCDNVSHIDHLLPSKDSFWCHYITPLFLLCMSACDCSPWNQ